MVYEDATHTSFHVGARRSGEGRGGVFGLEGWVYHGKTNFTNT